MAPKPGGRRRKGTPSINLTGRKIGRWLVGEYVPKGSHPKTVHHAGWKCVCECGRTGIVWTGPLNRGASNSCGCITAETASRRSKTHGKSRTAEHTAWKRMVGRCHNSRSKDWKNYGGRGIKVCAGLKQSFSAFLALIGDRPSESHSIDRRDNSRNYACGRCKECAKKKWELNVRWATRGEQNRNRRNTLTITWQGITRPLAEWCEIQSIPYQRAFSRIARGWDAERALTAPPRRWDS